MPDREVGEAVVISSVCIPLVLSFIMIPLFFSSFLYIADYFGVGNEHKLVLSHPLVKYLLEESLMLNIGISTFRLAHRQS